MYLFPYVIVMRLHQAAIDARRRSRTGAYLGWSALAGALAAVMLAIAATTFALLWLAGVWWAALVLGVFTVLPVIAPVVTRHALVPLGWVRAAYYGGLWCRPGEDPAAYGLCCAAWAFARRPSPQGERWLIARRDGRVPLGDAEVVVTALMVAGRGDAGAARELLRSVAMLVERHPAVRELAGEWLAVDAAARGAWRELHDDARAARWPATPLTFLLEAVAARHVDPAAAPRAAERWSRWLLAPYRRATYDLVAGPLAAVPSPAPDPAPAQLPDDAAPLPRAVAAHVAFGATPPSAGGLADAVRAWDAALADAQTHGWLARRALELDAPLGAVDRVLREVATAVTDELARAAEAARLGAPAASGPVGDALARRLRHGRLDALEAGFNRWVQRRHDGTVRAPIDEWREFVALHAAYGRAVTAGGSELRRLAFPHAFSTASSMSAWLWNTRSEHVISHAISRWLLDEALAVGDTEAIELGHRNCRLIVPTRLGAINDPT